MKFGASLALIGMMGVAACTSVESNIGLNDDTALRGVAYMVPTQRITLTATRTDPKPIPLQKAWAILLQAKVNSSAATAELTAAKKALDAAEANIKAYEDARVSNPAYRAELVKTRDQAKTAWQKATKANDDALSAASKAYEEVRKQEMARGVAPRWEEAIKLVASPPVGDPTLRFAASPNFNALRSDEGQLTVANGLLQSANATSSGEVDEIIVSAFRAASVFGIGLPGVPTPEALSPSIMAADHQPSSVTKDDKLIPLPVTQCDDVSDPTKVAIPPNYILHPNILSLSFDPSNPDDIRETNKALCHSGYSLRFHVRLNGESPSGGSNTAAGIDTLCDASKTCPGLLYRSPQPFVFQVVEIYKDDHEYVRHQQTLSLVSGAPLRMLEYEASPFTTVNNDAEFQAGVLVSYEYDRPGAVDEIVNIPFRAVSAATEAISTLVQLRLNITDKTKDIRELEAEIANLASTENAANELSIAEKQLELLKVQKEILEIQADIDALNQTGDTP